MNDVAIRVEHLSKRYRIGPSRDARSPRESLAAARRVLGRSTSQHDTPAATGRAHSAGQDEVWALKDISFEVKRGEVLGVIGRNGSGKSTLLKILSRVTVPTLGNVELQGRVGSLLEVGTGFHPELTGRENVYLNGAILGMKKSEIRSRFDEIVEFSEIGRFIDTPVKHYSTGMYVRLAFGVAAHFDSEILLVDEVLAVGDAAFQQKCLGRMGATAQQGRTVLLVSHNVLAVESLCTTSLLLREGRVDFLGATTQGVSRYLDTGPESPAGARGDLTEHAGRRLGADAVIRGIEVIPGGHSSMPEVGAPLAIELQLDPGPQRFEDCAIGIGILSLSGQLLVPFKTRTQYSSRWSLEEPRRVAVRWRHCCLPPGRYRLRVAFSTRDRTVDWVDDALKIEVHLPHGGTVGTDYSGLIVPEADWTIGTEERGGA